MENSLMESLKAKNDYFKQMVNLIPPQFYFEQEPAQVTGTGKYFKNPKENAPQQSRKEHVKAKKAANKVKRLDPTQHKTVTDIQDEMAAAAQKAQEGGDEEDHDDSSSDESEDEGVHSAAESSDDDEPKKKRMKGQTMKPMSVEKVRTGASIDELKEKLQKRIQELKLKRKAPMADGDNPAPRKLSKKMKRAEQKKKEKMEAIQASKRKLQEAMNNKAKQRAFEEEGGSGSQAQEATQNQKTGDVAFSKFAFEEFDFAKEQKMKKKKKKRDDPRSGKDYTRLLKKVEKHKEELTELKEKDPEKAQQVITKETWQKAMNKAQGIKIKDDPDLLKKSMKREKQKKKRSAKSWKAREKQTQKLIKTKQEKRDRNIKARKDTKKAKKVKRLQKKGKLLLQD